MEERENHQIKHKFFLHFVLAYRYIVDHFYNSLKKFTYKIEYLNKYKFCDTAKQLCMQRQGAILNVIYLRRIACQNVNKMSSLRGLKLSNAYTDSEIFTILYFRTVFQISNSF